LENAVGLDVGCGTGILTLFAAKVLPCSYYILDLIQQAILNVIHQPVQKTRTCVSLLLWYWLGHVSAPHTHHVL
jgi:methylase of polypeptide subunit release factors